MTQFEFYKSFQFVLELMVAESLFVYRFNRKSKFPLRLALAVAACFLFAFLFPVFANDPFYCSFVFLMIFIFNVLACKTAFNESWLTVVFCCIAGYTTQHLAYELYNLALVAMNGNISTGFYGQGSFAGIFPNLLVAVIYAVIYVITYWLCSLFFARKLDGMTSIKLKGTFLFVFAILILVVDILLNAIVVFYPWSDGGKMYLVIIGVYNIICCIVSLFLQFEVSRSENLEGTVDRVRHMYNASREQYAASKENIEMINMKCHDFKHQVQALKESLNVNSDAITELQNRISIYDSSTQTGNDALDLILTEKSLLCNNNGIKFGIIADGARLGFMSPEDIYALFGNIVDNAIEAVLRLDRDLRNISLHVKAQDEILIVREENYFAGELTFEDGLPKTTKPDSDFHGYGLKSIRYICERYDGNMTVKAENNIFRLNLIFPLSCR